MAIKKVCSNEMKVKLFNLFAIYWKVLFIFAE